METYTNVKNILFDFGGVIVGLNKQSALNKFKEIGFKNIEEYLGQYRQKGIFLDYEIGKIGREEFLQEFRRIGENEASMEDVDSAWMAFFLDIPAYKYQLIEDLKKKYNVYLLSNTNPSVMKWANSSAFSSKGKSIKEYFDKSYLSYELGCAKPDKEIFELIIKDSGMKPEETLFFDDGPANIEVAKELGFQVYLTDQDEDLRKVFERVQ